MSQLTPDPPLAELAEPDVVRTENLIRARDGATFQPRCVYCNAACDGAPKKFRFAAIGPGGAGVLAAGVLGGAIGGALAADALSSTAPPAAAFTVYAHVCRPHRRAVLRQFLTAGAILAASVAGALGVRWAEIEGLHPMLLIAAGLIGVAVYAAAARSVALDRVRLHRRGGQPVPVEPAGDSQGLKS